MATPAFIAESVTGGTLARASGFGMNASNATGYTSLVVNTLLDDAQWDGATGASDGSDGNQKLSLRWAVEDGGGAGSRYITFDSNLKGVIDCRPSQGGAGGDLTIGIGGDNSSYPTSGAENHSNIYIDGRGAGGYGIAIYTSGFLLRNARDLVLRFLRIYSYDPADESEGDGATQSCIRVTRNFRRIMVDHCSLYWACDQIVSFDPGSQSLEGADITIQYSILANGDRFSSDPESTVDGAQVTKDGAAGTAKVWGAHAYGTVFSNVVRMSCHHNFFSNNFRRCPRVAEGFTGHVHSNITYNYGRAMELVGNEPGVHTYVAVVNNIMKEGPCTTGAILSQVANANGDPQTWIFNTSGDSTTGLVRWVSGNRLILRNGTVTTADPGSIGGPGSTKTTLGSEAAWDSATGFTFADEDVSVVDDIETELFDSVSGVGATLPARSLCDQRLIDEYNTSPPHPDLGDAALDDWPGGWIGVCNTYGEEAPGGDYDNDDARPDISYYATATPPGTPPPDPDPPDPDPDPEPEVDPNVVLDIDFEDETTYPFGWTRSIPAGISARTTGAAMAGTTYGHEIAVVDQTDRYFLYEHGSSIGNILRLRFYWDPNGIVLETSGSNANYFTLMRTILGTSNGGSIGHEVQVHRGSPSGYLVRVKADSSLGAGSDSLSGWYPVTDDAHYIEYLVDTTAGTHWLFIDGVSKFSAAGLTLSANTGIVRLGYINYQGYEASGTMYIDEFILRDDDTEIGAHVEAPPVTVDPSTDNSIRHPAGTMISPIYPYVTALPSGNDLLQITGLPRVTVQDLTPAPDPDPDPDTDPTVAVAAVKSAARQIFRSVFDAATGALRRVSVQQRD